MKVNRKELRQIIRSVITESPHSRFARDTWKKVLEDVQNKEMARRATLDALYAKLEADPKYIMDMDRTEFIALKYAAGESFDQLISDAAETLMGK